MVSSCYFKLDGSWLDLGIYLVLVRSVAQLKRSKFIKLKKLKDPLEKKNSVLILRTPY